MFVSTSSLSDPFDVIDTIFAVTATKATVFDGPNASSAFDQAKGALLSQCAALGGDAVINCNFEHRSAQSGGFMPQLVIEFFATGTVVKLRGAG